MLLEGLLTFLIAWLVLSAFRKARLSKRWLETMRMAFEKESSTQSWEEVASIFLLIPALREQAVIEGTLAWLSRLNYPCYRIVVALDGKEAPDLGGSTTKDVVERFIHSSGKVTTPPIEYVLYCGIEQGRAYQLNVALEHVKRRTREEGLAQESVWVGVYDADSRPHPDILRYLCWRIQCQPKLLAFQQTLDYRLNLEAIRKQRFSGLLEGNAVYQTAWNSFFEIPRFLETNKQIENGHSPSLPPYCMGHGEFVRLDILSQLGGFSIHGPADGIQLGFALSKRRIAIEPVPLPDICESPTSCGALIHQHSLWFAGNLTVFRYILAGRNESWILSLRQFFNHFVLNLKWLLRPLYVLILFYLLIWHGAAGQVGSWLLSLLLLAALLGYVMVIIQAARPCPVFDDRGILWERKRPPRLYWILAGVGFKSIGAWLGLFKVSWSAIARSPLKFPKRERLPDE